MTETLPEGWFIVHDEMTANPKKDKPGAPLTVRAASVDSVWGYESGGSTLCVRGAFLHVTESRDEVLALVARHTEREVNTS